MIPYFDLAAVSLGPVTIQTWGFFVALGFLAGAGASARLSKQRELKPAVVWDTLALVIIGSMIGARIFHIVFYEPAYYLAHSSEILAVWHGGLSMAGGLIGAAAAGVGYLKYKKLALLQYADMMIFGLPLGYFIGRLGCFLIHDHPGLPTNFFLGARYPDGVIRHDLGLYHSLLGLVIFFFFLVLLKRKARAGSFLFSFLIIYGLARLLLDFLRIGEMTYLFLTPAQWFGILMTAGGIYLLKKYGRET